MYPAFLWSVLLAIMDISARASSLPERPRLGHLGHQCSHAPGRPNLHLVSSSRRPRQVTGLVATVHAASSLASKTRPLANTLQAMRASLLASAIASTLRCSRFLAASIQGLNPWRSQLFGLISTTHAACTNRTR